MPQSDLPEAKLDELRDDFKRLRNDVGASQSDVARVLGLTQAAVSQFENGTSQQPRRGTLQKIQRLVEVWRVDVASDTDNIVELPKEIRAGAYKCPFCLLHVAGPDDDHHFCSKCGQRFPTACDSCGHDNPGGSVFCNRCAFPLHEDVSRLPKDERGDEATQIRNAFLADFVRWFNDSGASKRYLKKS